MTRSTPPAPLAAALALLATVAGCAAPSGDETRAIALQDAVRAAPALNPDGSLNVLVEIPAGTNQKWEASKDAHALSWEQRDDGSGERRVIAYLPYPANYGMVPGTLLAKRDGGDGDPLDVWLLGPATRRGALVAAHLIGVIAMTDDGERDDKLLAVAPDGPFASVADAGELDERFPGTTAILATWLSHYKGPDRVVVEGLRGREAALQLVEHATAH